MASDFTVFDFHFHFFSRDGSNIDVVRGSLQNPAVRGILCCTDLPLSDHDPVALNAPLFSLAADVGRNKLPLLATVHPSQQNWRGRLAKMLDASAEIVGIKLHPPAGGYEVTEALLAPVFEAASERKLIVASHTCPVPGSSAIAFLPLVRRFSDVPFVIYHASTHEESAYMSMRGDVYVEPSWLGFFRPVFDMVGKLGGYRRLLAGTDGPGWFSGFDGDPYDDLVRLALGMLPDDVSVRAFLCGNAERLLGLIS
ncbi:MAG: amidohydrolase family protein [Planctomycetes bacterium]|nr:amidohydrolase family protein [Planctomycetota bacterium]